MSDLRKLDVSGYGRADREARARWEAEGSPDYGHQPEEIGGHWYLRPPWEKPQTGSLLRPVVRQEPGE